MAQSPFLIVRNALCLVTMDEGRREIKDGALVAENGVVIWVGTTTQIPQAYLARCGEPHCKIIDASGQVVTPGLINTHHHMFQNLTRVLPAAQDAELFAWLSALYPLWAGLTSEMMYVSAVTAMAELMASGCTTSSDHHYIYPNDCKLDASIAAARSLGLRFHAARGSMSVGKSQGGLPPDRVVEREDFILKDTQRLIETFHDAAPYSMLRLVVAPCSPFTVSENLMRESAKLARAFGVSMHTHLAESEIDVAYSLERFGKTPAQYAESLDWVGPDVWHAHCVKLDEHGIELFARTGTGVAHCPCSNMRLASGIAPIRAMRDHGVAVGLGVDGSSSNDGAHLLGEARQAMLLQRVGFGPKAMGAREALELATLGGAKVLGRQDLGALAKGMACDLAMFEVSGLDHAGSDHDPVAALVFCTPVKAKNVVINGRLLIENGQFNSFDLDQHLPRHRLLSRRLVAGNA